MATPEAAFAARVRDGLRALGLDTERIENRVNLGVPDLLVGAGETFAMVELKAVAQGLKVGLRPHQVAFLTRHSAKGRPCFVLVHQLARALKPGRILLYTGRQAPELLVQGLRLAPVAAWPDRVMPWDQLAAALLGKLPIK